uniref:Parvalbumin n=1 Tax=Oncorhynchus mykiss TaxID=8022 RepID=A0A8K9Y6L1_ONCMY
MVGLSKNGYIEQDDLQLFLQNFSKGAHPLTAAETRAFLLAGDNDRGGKIGWDGRVTRQRGPGPELTFVILVAVSGSLDQKPSLECGFKVIPSLHSAY